MLLKRRLIMKGLALLLASSQSLVVFAQNIFTRPDKAFESKSQEDVLKALFGDTRVTVSDQIEIKVPEIAENGSTVPVSISAEMENVESISIVVSINNKPLAGNFVIPPRAYPFVSTRIKMGKSGNVIAVVKTKDQLFMAEKPVKVTLGGCGG